MIEVTRLNGSKLMINALLIEMMEQTPDTLITMTTGKKLVVLEPTSVLAERSLLTTVPSDSTAASIKSGLTEENML